jgi:hypothetical protein
MYGLGKVLNARTLAKSFSKSSLLTTDNVKLLLTNDNFFNNNKISSYFKDQFFLTSLSSTFHNFLVTFHSPIYLYPKNDLYMSSFLMLNNTSKILNLSELIAKESNSFNTLAHLKSKIFLSSFFYAYFVINVDSEIYQSP